MSSDHTLRTPRRQSKQHGIAQTNGRSLSSATKTAMLASVGAMVPTVPTGGREGFGVPGELNRQVAVTGAVTRFVPKCSDLPVCSNILGLAGLHAARRALKRSVGPATSTSAMNITKNGL